MNRICTLVFIAIFLPLPLFPQADTTASGDQEDSIPGIWEVVAGGGVSIPFEPENFDRFFKSGYSAGGGIAYSFPPGDVGYGEVSLMVQYYNVPFDETGFSTANNLPAAAAVYGYAGDVFTAMGQFRGVFAGSKESVAPFFTVGVGLYHIALPQMGIENAALAIVEEYKKTTLGWSVGLGVDVPIMEKFTFFVDGRFLLGVTETNGHKLFEAGGGLRIKI